jgi:lipoyl(octanoyl) transferase
VKVNSELNIRRLGLVPYEPTWRSMQQFSARRDETTADELWLLQHPPVYTLGVAGRSTHLPRAHHDIPVVRIDRGGQITYHGPGQVVIYTLLDLARRGIAVRELVRMLERAVMVLLARHGIRGESRIDAPGVYVDGAKIAALGLRVRKACCYHGLALNVAMDLSPFSVIDPCGYPGMRVTCLRELGVAADPAAIGETLIEILRDLLNAKPMRSDG